MNFLDVNEEVRRKCERFEKRCAKYESDRLIIMLWHDMVKRITSY